MSKTPKSPTAKNLSPGAQSLELAPKSTRDALAFDALDLTLIERGAGAPFNLRDAARLLIELCGDAPDIGRFTLDDYAATGQEIGAMFRICRGALDFLEADFLDAVKSEAEFCRVQAEAFEALLK